MIRGLLKQIIQRMTPGATADQGTGRVHDYSHGNRRWGHDVHFTPVTKDGKKLKAFGWGYNLQAGEFILLSGGGISAYYRINTIEYYRDPPDMWTADLVFAPRFASKGAP